MVRAIAAVVAGYLVMAVLVMVSLTLAWLALGPSFAFEEGSTRVTSGWLAINLPLSFVAAVLGGWVAAWIARGPGAVRALAGLILVVGLALAVAHLVAGGIPADAPPERPMAELGSFEAASQAVQPTWYDFVIPWIGVVGVFAGGRLRRVGP